MTAGGMGCVAGIGATGAGLVTGARYVGWGRYTVFGVDFGGSEGNCDGVGATTGGYCDGVGATTGLGGGVTAGAGFVGIVFTTGGASGATARSRLCLNMDGLTTMMRSAGNRRMERAIRPSHAIIVDCTLVTLNDRSAELTSATCRKEAE